MTTVTVVATYEMALLLGMPFLVIVGKLLSRRDPDGRHLPYK